MTLPFEPASVPVKNLAGRLEWISDEETVHALQRADTRKTAAAVYERRVDEIRRTRPELEAEELERGYHVGRWAGRMNYECLACPFKHLDRARIIEHVAQAHN